MVHTFGSILGVSKQTEMLVMSFLTLWTNVFDMALFELGASLEQVWNVPVEITKFTPEAQNFMKIILSGVVFVRTFSLHIYIAFVIAMFWPITFGTHPTLMLPWLTVSAIKNLGAGIITFIIGVYTCMIYGPLRPACINFLGSQILDMAPSFYMWIIGISLYRDLLKPAPVDRAELKNSEEEELNMALRRRKVKSMVDEEILREQFESRRKFIGTSAVEVKDIFAPSTFEEHIRRKISRSLDSLLDAMNAEAEILDLEEFEPLEDGLKLSEKTAKLLGITMSEIKKIQDNRQSDLNFAFFPIKIQKQQINTSNSIMAHESPLKLLTETSLYTPSSKQVRPTKSELKSPKDFLNLKSPTDFMQSVPEYEVRFSNYNQDLNSCVTETIFEAFDVNQNPINETDSISECYEIIKPKSLTTIVEKTNNQDDIKRPECAEKLSLPCVLTEKYIKIPEPVEKIRHPSVTTILKTINEASEYEIKCPNVTTVDENTINKNDIKKPESPEKTKRQSGSTGIQLRNSEMSRSLTMKKSSEMGCQVCTLSRKILNAPAKEMSEKLSHKSSSQRSKRSRTIDIRPPSASSQSRNSQNSSRPQSTYSQLSRPQSTYNQRESNNENNFIPPDSPREPKSYLTMHLNKLERDKTIESKFGLSKFGIENNTNINTDGLTYNTCKTEDETKDNPSKGKVENISL